MVETVDITKARQVLRAVIELHAGHINGTEAMTPKSLQREMDLLETAFKALGGSGGPGGM